MRIIDIIEEPNRGQVDQYYNNFEVIIRCYTVKVRMCAPVAAFEALFGVTQ